MLNTLYVFGFGTSSRPETGTDKATVPSSSMIHTQFAIFAYTMRLPVPDFSGTGRGFSREYTTTVVVVGPGIVVVVVSGMVVGGTDVVVGATVVDVVDVAEALLDDAPEAATATTPPKITTAPSGANHFTSVCVFTYLP